MNCLYSGDKPLGIVQSNAEDVEYSSGVSVKDKIDTKAEIAYVSGTLASSANWSSSYNLPTGYTFSNTCILSLMVKMGNDSWRSMPQLDSFARTFVQLDNVNQIKVYNADTSTFGKDFIIAIGKMPS